MSGKPVKKAKTGGVPPAAPAPAPVTGAKRAARAAAATATAAAATAHSKKSTAPPAAKRARVVAKKPVSRAAEVEEDDYLSSGTESDELDLTKTYSRAAPRRRGGADAFASSDSEAEAGSSDDSGEGSDFDEVSVEFEFRDPAEIQYKSVRRLMEHFLPGEEETFDVSGMADAIVGQVQLGTMVCVADDLDVYAFATILSVNKYREAKWMQQIRAYLLAKAKDGGPKTRLTALFDDAASNTGLLINERVVNMPPQLAPAIHNSLSQDLAWALEHADEVTRAAGAFQFDNLLMVAPCFTEAVPTSQALAHSAAVSTKRLNKHRNLAGRAAGGKGEEKATIMHYYHFEEEIFAACAHLSFTFAVQDGAASGASAAPAALVSAPTATGAAAAATNSSAGSASSAAVPASDAVLKSALKKGGKAPKGGKAAAAHEDSDDSDEAEMSERLLLRPPQVRHVFAFPAVELTTCVSSIENLVELAKDKADDK